MLSAMQSPAAFPPKVRHLLRPETRQESLCRAVSAQISVFIPVTPHALQPAESGVDVRKMTECLGESDLNLLAKSTLEEFDQEIASLQPELCVPFNQAAMRLEGELLILDLYDRLQPPKPDFQVFQ